MRDIIVKLVRYLTGRILFRKRLPEDFKRAKVYVTTRSDLRLIAPGLIPAAGDIIQVVRQYVKEGDVVWDIGSNLGILTFCSAIKVGSRGKVYSLEADPQYAHIQSRTLQQFPAEAGQVSILCAAIANQLGILDLILPKRGHARNHLKIVSHESSGEPEMIKQVVSVTLDWLLQFWGLPDFVKIDVEGAELLALQDAEVLFNQVRPVVYIECSSANAASLTQFFESHDYALFALDEQGIESPITTCHFNTLAKPKVRL